ncbi:MAG: hypothetical protein IPH13_00890 [Planctomycetes bacterium]|nr:hypothetical protein [Planctomycetota bacterium]MCC7172456.1 hypothetical protein [Planctomycetota bacterium]
MPTAAIALLLGSVLAVAAGDPRYVDDFDFIRTTVAQKGAAVHVRKLDWKAICDRFEPRFTVATSDADHVKNVMELLATLGDAHTGITRSSVPWDDLPRKFDGIFGGGMWWRYDAGKFVVAGYEGSVDRARVPPLGSALIEIGHEPAWIALGRDHARLTRWFGTSSDHSLYASLGNALLPTRGANVAHVLVATPDGKAKDFELMRFAPNGKAFDPSRALLAPGIEWQEGAVSGFVEHRSGKRIGVLAITGGMDAATVTKFHVAFDRLKEMDALVLDARNAGGGGDAAAWEMAGRLYPKGEDNGLHGRIEPSGSWQFAGPVVFLQDASMVSSAETLTWAVNERGRCVSIGRATGGWGIIPNGFKCPSGLVDFRLGVNARPTPVKRVQTEGVGWPADVQTPPFFVWSEPKAKDQASALDPTLDLGLDVAGLMACGADREDVRTSFRALFDGKCDEFAKSLSKSAKAAPWFDAAKAAAHRKDEIKSEVEQEIALIAGDEVRSPDVLSSAARFPTAAARAKAAGFAKLADQWKAALDARKAEPAAQKALLEMMGEAEMLDATQRKAFLAKHGKARVAGVVRD